MKREEQETGKERNVIGRGTFKGWEAKDIKGEERGRGERPKNVKTEE